jgi:hypothetical protein
MIEKRTAGFLRSPFAKASAGQVAGMTFSQTEEPLGQYLSESGDDGVNFVFDQVGDGDSDTVFATACPD